MNKAGERLYNGLVKENPTFVLMLGMCPTLAVTTSAMNGLGMGLTTMVVLALSNMIISLLRKIIPNRVRIPAFIVIIASFVTIVQLFLEAYFPELNKSLGVYIPLIVVNCIILGRAESYAYFYAPVPSLFDGIGMGLGFTFALTCIGALRELLGAGELFGYAIMPASFEPIRIFGLAPGAFFVLAVLVAIQNYAKMKMKKAGKEYEKIGSGCTEDCMNCDRKGCTKRFYDVNAVEKAQEAASELEIEELAPEEETAEASVEQEPEPSVEEEPTAEESAEEASVEQEPEPSVEEEPTAEEAAVEQEPAPSVEEEPIAEESAEEAAVEQEPEPPVEEEPTAEESAEEAAGNLAAAPASKNNTAEEKKAGSDNKPQNKASQNRPSQSRPSQKKKYKKKPGNKPAPKDQGKEEK